MDAEDLVSAAIADLEQVKIRLDQEYRGGTWITLIINQILA
jgi:hypothetical protein